jgi:enoyl-CoA hydratase/carnithine racemase
MILAECDGARDLGLVTRVVPDRDLLATANETAQKLAAKPSGLALDRRVRSLRRAFRSLTRPTRAFWLTPPSRQHANLASRSAGKHTRRHK